MLSEKILEIVCRDSTNKTYSFSQNSQKVHFHFFHYLTLNIMFWPTYRMLLMLGT